LRIMSNASQRASSGSSGDHRAREPLGAIQACSPLDSASIQRDSAFEHAAISHRRLHEPSVKAKELFYMIGLRPKAQTYGFEIKTFDLAEDGKIQYAQWLHPRETPKQITQESVDELRRFLSPSDVAIDIGAHSGDSTIPMALAVGKSGCVLALEPNSYVFPVLAKNAELNPDKTHIIPLPFAATPEDAELTFQYSDSGYCNGGQFDQISRWSHGHAFELRVQGKNLLRFLQKSKPELIPKIR
jgi:FkbM family methyltransferase